MLLNPLLMKEYQGHLSFFQACITQQEDTVVHSRTLDLFYVEVWETVVVGEA